MIIEINDRAGCDAVRRARSVPATDYAPLRARAKTYRVQSVTRDDDGRLSSSIATFTRYCRQINARARCFTVLQLATVYSYVLFVRRVDRSSQRQRTAARCGGGGGGCSLPTLE